MTGRNGGMRVAEIADKFKFSGIRNGISQSMLSTAPINDSGSKAGGILQSFREIAAIVRPILARTQGAAQGSDGPPSGSGEPAGTRPDAGAARGQDPAQHDPGNPVRKGALK